MFSKAANFAEVKILTVITEFFQLRIGHLCYLGREYASFKL